MTSRPPRQEHFYDYLIDAHGDWFCEGNPITDERLFRLLSRSLFATSEGYFVRCEGEVHPVRVADTPLFVRYVHVTEDAAHRLARVEIELTDGRREVLDPESLRIVDDRALYCRATRRRLPARFGKVAYYELARYIQWDEQDGSYAIEIAGRRHAICRV